MKHGRGQVAARCAKCQPVAGPPRKRGQHDRLDCQREHEHGAVEHQDRDVRDHDQADRVEDQPPLGVTLRYEPRRREQRCAQKAEHEHRRDERDRLARERRGRRVDGDHVSHREGQVPGQTDSYDGLGKLAAPLTAEKPREHHAGSGVADGDRRTADDQAERDVGQGDADHEHEQRDVSRDPLQARAHRPDSEVRNGQAAQPRFGKRPVALSGERQPSGSRERERIDCEQEARGRLQASSRNSQLEPDRRSDAERPKRDQRKQGAGHRTGFQEPADPLWACDDETGEAEPVPALPEQHADRRGVGHEQQPERRPGLGRAREHWGKECADDPDGADRRGRPAHGERGAASPHEHCKRERHRSRNQVVDLGRHGHGQEQTGEGGARDRQRRVRPAPAFVKPHAEGEERGRGASGHDGARGLADPSVRDREGEEERPRQHHRNGADQSEDAATEEVLEVQAGLPGRRGSGSRGRHGPRRVNRLDRTRGHAPGLSWGPFLQLDQTVPKLLLA